MSEAKGQHEPSMEEILASIRRIIAEDGDNSAPEGAAAAAPVAVAAKPVNESAGDEILELTEVVEPEEPPVKVEKAKAAPEPDPEPPPARATARPAAPIDAAPPPVEAPIVSPATAAASVAALSRITELSSRNDSDISLGAGHLTLEALVREELRPILRDWLDAHLPDIVERIVKNEITRLVQGVAKR